MALVKSPQSGSKPVAGNSSRGLASPQDIERQRRYARTLAKQQQAAERVAAATGQLASGINEAASAAEELKRASDQIATGAEEASGASQESMTALTQVAGGIARQLQNAEIGRIKAEASSALVAKTSAELASLITNVGVAAQRQ